jgi:hypothetical protein
MFIEARIRMGEHELGFLEFLAEPSRRRVSALFEMGKRKRQKFCAMLDHDVMLDPRYCEQITGSLAVARSIEAELKKRGAPSLCFVISADNSLDGREMPLRVALDAIVGANFGSFISCVPGKLGYYEYEDAKSSYMLRK